MDCPPLWDHCTVLQEVLLAHLVVVSLLNMQVKLEASEKKACAHRNPDYTTICLCFYLAVLVDEKNLFDVVNLNSKAHTKPLILYYTEQLLG